jgi:hypothetical protein
MPVANNGAGVRYVDPSDGQQKIEVRFSGNENGSYAGMQSHSEYKIDNWLRSRQIPRQNIREFYSELAPCSLPGGQPGQGCSGLLSRNYPGVPVTYSFEYGSSKSSRTEGMQKLVGYVQHLF